MKINFACGKHVLPGFFNVDAVQHPKAQAPLDLKHAFEFAPDGGLINPLPLEDGCASEIQCMHFIEHVYQWEAPHIVGEWHRLLRRKGILILELPNLEHACRNLIAGLKDQQCMWPLYGDPGHRDPYMCHKWGYTPGTIKSLLSNNGFAEIVLKPPVTHGARRNRDMRVEAVRK